jgi:ABC-2 type transport system ATP-binding protein
MADPPLEAFKALPFVKSVEVREGSVWLAVERAASNLQQIMEAAGKREVTGVELRRPTLEDVFISLTGRAIRQEEGASGGWMAQVMTYQSSNQR